VHRGISWGNLRNCVHVRNLGVHGRIILRYIFRKWDVDVESIRVAHDTDRRRAVAISVINLHVP
jgi:hypothetical protein